MTENVQTLILDHLHAIRTDMARMNGAMNALQGEVGAIRQLMSGARTMEKRDKGDIVATNPRFDSIQKRSEPTD